MKIVVLCPHFQPDTAPTGTVITRIVSELAALGHELHVVTALPWYREHRIEPEWTGKLIRTEQTAWGTVTRVHPFPNADKRNLLRRAAGFAGFSLLAGMAGLRAGGWFRRADVVLAMSPPLTLGLTGWVVSRVRRAKLLFNIQDVFPDAAVRTGALTNTRVIGVAEWLERVSYHRSDAVTVLSDDLRDNVVAKVAPKYRQRVHVIPNFVDTERILPADRMTGYRDELGIGSEVVVLYAGNVGFSQSLDLVVHAARQMPDVTFVVNGQGAARDHVAELATGMPNVRLVGYQPIERLPEVLASGDIHVVPLRAGLGNVSVPSKTYSSLAAARPVVAAIDLDSEIPRLLSQSGGGVAVPPDHLEAFVHALRSLVDDPEARARMGESGRSWVVREASPAAVGQAYDRLMSRIADFQDRRTDATMPR
ncbi:MAG TPA: glycosyltransferase family 4 protein [Ilumatobacter sp.]|nr:glycosyltransferase family 4 protein [Ilumatobacter sp.]